MRKPFTTPHAMPHQREGKSSSDDLDEKPMNPLRGRTDRPSSTGSMLNPLVVKCRASIARKS
ncbi:hypothetical protein OKW35_005025 [Paraburkholderia sp. MM5477-R1]